MGLGGRLHLAWISSAEAQKFARVVTDFTDHIRGLGPNPLKALERPRGGQPHGDAIGERAQSYALAGREMERV
jgi:hypothetical protein